jgi:hypothetical protein
LVPFLVTLAGAFDDEDEVSSIANAGVLPAPETSSACIDN